ncbi:kinesin-like protein KIN-7F [Senna tora]|uniref:Kinesin-like protein n=1 Tax=Senna tora TaxID=362788 RepID=A0A834T9G7_9FABA|nr:kinesin-like protein KIN-7F [Senna tora]
MGDTTPRSNGNEDRISVSVRVRPLSDKERARRDVSEWECISPNTIKYKTTLPESSISLDTYTFHKVFGDGCSTQQVYEAAIKQAIVSVVSGINSSVLAYGQTSSGKTYTMTGITEYAIRDIYDYIDKHRDREFVLKFSAMEIYNEIVRDLLSTDNTPLRLLDDREKGIVIEKLTEEILTERSRLQELLSICAAERTTKETSMNETSSRSHQIIRLTVESSPTDYVGTNRSGTLVASVNFVDLAGSERASHALTAGTRLREGGHINRSLLTLGTVIRKLSKGINGYIPYRDSKLTRILQKSLGGNARTYIICTISPTRNHVEQSKNTLFFASCAKQVTTNAQVNVVMSDKILVKRLQNELARMENELRSFAPNTMLLKEREHQIEQMDKKIKELTRQRDIFQSHIANLLKSVGKDQPLTIDIDPAPESSDIANNDLVTDLSAGSTYENSNKLRPIESFKHIFQQPENPEDNFLLDGNIPEFIGPDPCLGWEEISSRVDTENEDNRQYHKKDVNLFIPTSEDIGGKSPMSLFENGDAELASKEENNELTLVTVDNSHEDDLRRKIQVLQRTIDRLVGFIEKSNGSSEPHISKSRSLQIARSKSCSATSAATSHFLSNKVDEEIMLHFQSGNLECEVMSSQLNEVEQKAESPSQFNEMDKELASPPQFDETELKTMLLPQLNKLEEETITSPAKFEIDNSTHLGCFQDKLSDWEFHVPKRKFSREHFQIHQMDTLDEVESVIDSDTEDTASVLNFVVKMNGRSRTRPSKDFDDPMIRARTPGFKDMRRARVISFHGVPGALLPCQFERQQRYMVELWDTCNVPLAHRSYFFLLIKGELGDSVYLDLELRRLSFLKDTFSTGTRITEDGQNLTLDSSLEALNREREMLSKKMHKKFSWREREKYYMAWGIDLKSKQRSTQLAWQLWTNTKDMNHIRESATLVAKLIGLVESNETSKKGFGLNFVGLFKSRKSHNWNDTTSTVM